jgi:hypothetical protein
LAHELGLDLAHAGGRILPGRRLETHSRGVWRAEALNLGVLDPHPTESGAELAKRRGSGRLDLHQGAALEVDA